MNSFEQANKVVHPVETQWHFKYMTKHGWVPETQDAVGFVRSYRYVKGDRVIVCNTGSNSDYWSEEGRGRGYWGSLETHLEK